MPGRKKATDARSTANEIKAAAPRRKAPARPKQGGEAKADAAGVLTVVGMVASAGGLAAFKDFFNAMPAASGMAFLVIPHLDPKHESLMAPLLAKHTAMPVTEATHGERLEPDHVYVIPPDRYLTLQDGVIHLVKPTGQGAGETAIDPFLRSLADDQHDRSICIILSGTGAHGSLGLKAVKAAGGMAMVQEPASAEYDRMPRNAIDTGLADYVLPPARMPAELVKYVRHFVSGTAAQTEPAAVQDDLTQVLALLRARTKFDFRAYRKRMLLRRVQRRMGLNHLDLLPDYLALLRKQPDELDQLCRDLLISVTSFFRDQEMYKILETEVLPELIARHDTDTPIRIWVPGCATGEEAYSIAMLFTESIGALGKACPIQVFATDVDELALGVARRGIYPEAVLADLDRKRLERFFVKVDDRNWQVDKQLREAVLFATQNMLADAPFSRLDLVSCRNLLIYLEPEVQQKVLQLLHFALTPGGYLILGPSESIGQHVELYEPVSKKWRVFRRSRVSHPARADFPIMGKGRSAEATLPAVHRPPLADSVGELTRKVLLDSYAPAAVVINDRYQVVHYSGPTRAYLQQPAGPPTDDLLALALAGLRPRIRAAVQQAAQQGHRFDIHGVRVNRDGQYARVLISAQPMEGKRVGEGLMLVTFQDEPEAPQTMADVKQVEVDELLVRQLELELKTTREELQSTIEELESSNEELKASNEEVMSMNEELQSTNEELETSKEELQSLNEELTTVNAQLRDKVDELEGANNDMANLLASVDIATLFLGKDGRIKRFTPSATRLFNLIASDLGRPIRDITARFDDPELAGDIDRVMQQLTPREREVRGEGERWYLRRLMPYRTADNRIDGVVLTFADTTLIKQADSALRDSEERFRALVQASSEVVYRMSPDWTEMRQLVGRDFIADTEAPSRTWLEKYIPADDRPQVKAAIEEVVRTKRFFELEHRVLRVDGSPGWTFSRAVPMLDAAGEITEWFGTASDITERKAAEAALQALTESLEQKVAERTANLEMEIKQRLEAEASLRVSEERLRTTFQKAPIGITQADPKDGRLLTVNPAYCAILGYSEAELIGRPFADFTHPEDREADREGFRQLVAGKIEIYSREKRYIRKDGSIVWVEVNVSLVRDADGRPLHTVAMIADIIERKRLEAALARRTDQLESESSFIDAVLNTQAALVMVADEEGRLVRFNRACELLTDLDFKHLRDTAGWQDLVPEEERAAIWHTVFDSLRSGERLVEHENHWICRDGTQRQIHWRNTALRDEQDRIRYIIGTGIDVTEERRLEREARKRLEELSWLQRQQTASELAGMIAHELNQPLAAISGYAETAALLLEKAPSEHESIKQNLDSIGTQCTRSADIIRRLRAFVKRERLSVRPLLLNAVVRVAIDLATPQLKLDRIRIETRFDDALPRAAGDDIYVQQVMINLLNNAADSIRNAGIEHGVISVRTSKEGEKARVTVSDNGPGIDPDRAAHLFEPVQSAKEQGLGMGLAISRSLTEAMNGRLWFEPKAPGTAFCFELPLAP